MKKFALIIALLAATGCTDAQQAKYNAVGTPARVTCFPGGKVFFDDLSTGKVLSEDHSDGYYFMSKTTGRLVEIQADCVVDHLIDTPVGWTPILP